LASWALTLVPTEMPHRGPKMSPRDARLVAAQMKATAVELREPLGVGLCCQLDFYWPARSVTRQHTPAHSRPIRVAGCSRLMVQLFSFPFDHW
jgi:hypothetical protein